MKGIEEISIAEVKRVNKEHGHHYFSPDTMRFFNSRTSERAYKVGNKAYFITSEQNKHTPRGGHTNVNPRKWSIRVIDLPTGTVNMASKFQEFYSNREAEKELKAILEGCQQ